MPKSGDIVKNYKGQTYLFVGHFVHIRFSVNRNIKLDRKLASVYVPIYRESELTEFEDNFKEAFMNKLIRMYFKGKNIQNIVNTPSNYRVVKYLFNCFGYRNERIKANYKGKKVELEVVTI